MLNHIMVIDIIISTKVIITIIITVIILSNISPTTTVTHITISLQLLYALLLLPVVLTATANCEKHLVNTVHRNSTKAVYKQFLLDLSIAASARLKAKFYFMFVEIYKCTFSCYIESA